MAILNKIFPLLMGVTLTGCYDNFTPDVPDRPVLCLNARITAEEPVEVRVTRTWMYDDEAGARNHDVDDAQVSVYANGELQSPGYLPKDGDRVRIVAESRRYGSAEAEVTVPMAVPVDAVECTPILGMSWVREEDGEMRADLWFDLDIHLTFTDPPGRNNYYHVSFDTDAPTGWEGGGSDLSASGPDRVHFSHGTLVYDAEPVFAEHIGVFESIMGGDADGFTFFTDSSFSGKIYSLHLRFENAFYSVRAEEIDRSMTDCRLIVTLTSVSESYYNWANYLWQRDSGPLADIGSIGFGDPVWGYSNVSSGAGVVAAQTQVSCTVPLEDFIADALSQASALRLH